MNNHLETKRIFLVASDNKQRIDFYKEAIQKHISNSTVYTATDGSTALAKIENAPPHIVILDKYLPKISGEKLIEIVMSSKNLDTMCTILVGELPEKEIYLDELVTGRLQYLIPSNDESEFNHCLVRALNHSSHSQNTDFYLKFLTPNELLLRQGDIAKYVYIVRRGTLNAYIVTKDGRTDLGKIECGEFVGEMSFINSAPRSANVVAETDCELIEIPINTFERILYQKPSWSKALMLTLSNRIKNSNQKQINNT